MANDSDTYFCAGFVGPFFGLIFLDRSTSDRSFNSVLAEPQHMFQTLEDVRTSALQHSNRGNRESFYFWWKVEGQEIVEVGPLNGIGRKVTPSELGKMIGKSLRQDGDSGTWRQELIDFLKTSEATFSVVEGGAPGPQTCGCRQSR